MSDSFDWYTTHKFDRHCLEQEERRMAAKKTIVPVRLAFRVEGDWWVCYAAKPDTMEEAIEMGRIAFGIARDEDRKVGFMNIMKDALTEFIEDKFGVTPEMVEQPGPESERSGSA